MQTETEHAYIFFSFINNKTKGIENFVTFNIILAILEHF